MWTEYDGAVMIHDRPYNRLRFQERAVVGTIRVVSGPGGCIQDRCGRIV